MAKGTKVTVVYNRFAEIAEQFPDAAFEIVGEAIADIDRAVKIGMGEAKSGEIYVRGGIEHQASAPGEMPAIDQGILRASMQAALDRNKGKGYYYTNHEAAAHLEYGTVYMEPRPFVTPAAESARDEFTKSMGDLESRLK